MSSRTPVLRLFGPTSLLLLALSASAQTAPGDALEKLVPERTAVYVRAPSLEKLGAAIRRIAAAFAPGNAPSFDIDDWIRSAGLPISPADIDHNRPIAFCLVLSEQPGGDPSPTLLVPAVSAEHLVQSIAGAGMPFTTSVTEGYVSVSMAPGTKPGPAPAAIAVGLPPGELVARVDVKRLVQHFRPMIEMGLGQVEKAMSSVPPQATSGMDLKPVLKMYTEGVRSVVDSGERLDLAVRLDGNRLEIASALTALEGSALAGFASKERTRAKDLARCLDPGASIGLVAGLDTAAMFKRFKPLVEASFAMYPEPLRADFRKAMESSDELAAQMGTSVCASGNFGADGLRYSLYLAPKDPSKLLALYRSMLESMPSCSVDEAKPGEIAGVPVTRMRLRIDSQALTKGLVKPVPGSAPGGEPQAAMQSMIEKMYGKDGLALTFATKGDITALVLGGDEAFLKSSLARLSAAGRPSGSVARGLGEIGDLNPCFLIRYDFGRVLHGMQKLMGDSLPGMPIAFPDVSASLTFWGGVDGRVWRGAISTDLAELGAMARAMQGSR